MGSRFSNPGQLIHSGKGPTAMSTRIALCDASGPLTDLLQKLAGERGEYWVRKLKKMLRDEEMDLSVSDFKVWRTLTLGNRSLKFFQELSRNGSMNVRVSEQAEMILLHPQFTVSSTKKVIKLACLHWVELGFKRPPTYGEIHKRALHIGFALCPPEVGPQAAIQYQDLPKGSEIYIAMASIPTLDSSKSSTFSLAHWGQQVNLNGGGNEDSQPDECREMMVYMIP